MLPKGVFKRYFCQISLREKFFQFIDFVSDRLTLCMNLVKVVRNVFTDKIGFIGFDYLIIRFYLTLLPTVLSADKQTLVPLSALK